MNTKNWTVRFLVRYPMIASKDIRECAKVLAAHLKIPYIAERKWKEPDPIILHGSIQFYPGDSIIGSSRAIPNLDLMYLRQDSKFMDHLGNALLEDITQFIHKEIRKKLGWSDD